VKVLARDASETLQMAHYHVSQEASIPGE